MPIVADAAVALRGDVSKLPGDLKKGEQIAQGFGAKLKQALSPKNILTGVGVGLGVGLTNAIGSAVGNITNFVGDSIGAASDLNETISKTGQILGDEALPELEKWAEGAADAFGQSQKQALDAASTFAIFGKSAGLAGGELVGFSTELSELASDLSSFFNTSPEDAITAIGAALRGESEPIRRYGVLLNDATLKQRALKLGLIETTTQALTPQQRVLAAQAEILAQTSDAQGDFARTSDGLANQQRILEANLANVSAEIGEALLPIMVDLAHFANDVLVPAIRGVMDVFGAVGDALGWLEDHFADSSAKMEAEAERLKGKMGELAEPAEHVTTEWDRTYRDLLTSSDATMRGIVERTKAASGEVGEAAHVMSVPISDALKKARIDAAREARAIPGDIAKALRQGQEDVDSGMEELTDLMENSLSDAAKIAHLKGVLASKELAAGLKDERADVRASALQIKEDAEEQLKLLESGAADAAVDAGTTMAEQLRLQEVAITQAAQDAVRGAKDSLEFADEAYQDGRNNVDGLIRGMLSKIGELASAASQVGHAARPPGTGLTPGFASGAWDIPSNMLANLHAHEMVIPADVANVIRGLVGQPQMAAPQPALVIENLTYTGNKDREEVADLLIELERVGRLPYR